MHIGRHVVVKIRKCAHQAIIFYCSGGSFTKRVIILAAIEIKSALRSVVTGAMQLRLSNNLYESMAYINIEVICSVWLWLA